MMDVGMLLKAAEIEQLKQGLHDPSSGLLERPGLDSGLDFQAPGTFEKRQEAPREPQEQLCRLPEQFCGPEADLWARSQFCVPGDQF